MIKLTLTDGNIIDIDPICIRKVYRNESKKCTDISFYLAFDNIKEPDKISVKESCKSVRMRIKDYFNEHQFSIFDDR